MSSNQLPIKSIEEARKDFPVLQQTVYDKPLVYLDNAATTQKPQCVIDRLTHFYEKENSNIHRSVFCLSESATREYEKSRHRIQMFLNARNSKEIIFVKGTTEGINLVASSYGGAFLKPGDEILITEMEHHSNIVPWQLIAERTGAKLVVAPITDSGELDMEQFQSKLSDKTKFVSIVHISNALGTVNDVKQVIEWSHAKGAVVLVDGAQAVAHMSVDVQDLDCDFYVFSGHKMLGPTGSGILYGKEELLDKMPPYQGGGDMINTVSFEGSTWNTLPYKFEAGTPNIASVIGLGEAVHYLEGLGLENIREYEAKLVEYALEKIKAIEGLRIIGEAKDRASVISFVLEEAHPQDIGTILDRQGIAVRAGHHCAMPVMKRFDVPATVRASFSFYNTKEEADALVASVRKVLELFN